jgi:poly(3-hydroxyalkanoate) synthetase
MPDVLHTPSQVVFRNTLIELIQYLPTTALVGPQPVLIVPPWIRARGVRDLPLGPALISWLVAQGRTLLAVAWNPDTRAHDVTLEDDRVTCLMAAVDVAGLICGNAKIHVAGYDLGGALLSLVASIMAHDADDRLASVSLFALGVSSTAAIGSDAMSPPIWEQEIRPHDASWWPQWAAWLARHSGPPMEPPPMDFALSDPTGAIVLEA